MPRYMLDTNMCIYLIKNQPEQVARRFAGCYVGDVVMSAITFAELDYGVSASDDPERERANLDAQLCKAVGEQRLPHRFDGRSAGERSRLRLIA